MSIRRLFLQPMYVLTHTRILLLLLLIIQRFLLGHIRPGEHGGLHRTQHGLHGLRRNIQTRLLPYIQIGPTCPVRIHRPTNRIAQSRNGRSIRSRTGRLRHAVRSGMRGRQSPLGVLFPPSIRRRVLSEIPLHRKRADVHVSQGG